MSKRAEEFATEQYPEKWKFNKNATGQYDTRLPRRKACIKGYEQAEKDLALTAEDVSCIIHLADQFGKDYQRIADVFNKDREEEEK